MSKLAVFLCVVICASAANSAFLSKGLEKVQQKVDQILDAAIKEASQQSKVVEALAEDLIVQLIDKANEIDKKVRQEINDISEKAKAEMEKLTSQAVGIDVTECTALIDHLQYTGLAVIANMSVCISDKLGTGYGYTNDIFNATMNVFTELDDIRKEAHHCGDNVNGVASAMAAIMCVNVAGARGTWAATKAVPDMTVKITKLNVLLATLVPSLAWCKTTTGIDTLYHESSTIAQRADACIRQKIDEVSGVTTPNDGVLA